MESEGRSGWRRRLATIVTAIAALVALLVPGRPGTGLHAARAVGQPGGVFVEPVPAQSLWVGSLDPALTTDAEVTQLIYAGLLKQVYNAQLGRVTIVPDLADRLPTISPDGLVYTFHLRAAARFSDGTPVTAQDVVYSLSRVPNPRTKSWASYYLGDILGAEKFNSGKAASVAGLTALDAQSVRITLSHPASHFPSALSYVTGAVVKSDLAIGAQVTTNPALVIGAGPWMLKNQTWQYRRQISLVPNPYYHGAERNQLKELDLVFTGSTATALVGYKSGQFPMAWLPAAEVARYKGTPEYHETPVLGNVWYAMNVKIAPFSNLHFRRAIAYAINREAIAQGVDRGTVKALYCWYPRGILGYDPGCRARYPHYDLAIAKREIALARQDLTSIPLIQLEYESDISDRGHEVLQIQADLKTIGVSLIPHPAPRSTWLKDAFTGKVPFIEESWTADYPDPQDFSDYLLKTGAGSNWAQYSNPTVDALIARADAERDPAIRARLYKQAQDQVMRDVPVVMAFQQAAQDLISTRYHGVELTPVWGNWPQPAGNDWANVSVGP